MTPHADLQARASERARSAEQSQDFPRNYVEQVRNTASRLAAPTAVEDDIRAAVAVLEQHAQINDVAPLDSTNRGTRAAKTVVRKAVFFTTHHLATQVSALGWAIASLGTATADRIEQLERRIGSLEVHVLHELREVNERLDRIDRDAPRQ